MERGFTLWFTGLSGSGKSTIANAITPKLQALGKRVEILDGDEVRTNLSKGDRKSTRLNSSHIQKSRMPSSA